MRTQQVSGALRAEKLWVLCVAALGVAVFAVGVTYALVSPSHLPGFLPGARATTRPHTHYHKRALVCFAAAALLFAVAYGNSMLRLRRSAAAPAPRATRAEDPSRERSAARRYFDAPHVRIPILVVGSALIGALGSYALDWDGVNTACSLVFYVGLGVLIATVLIDGILIVWRNARHVPR